MGLDFNPLSPHGERPSPDCCLIWVEDFNPLSPHGERRDYSPAFVCCINFNPLSPHGERLVVLVYSSVSGLFQSTLPAWGETEATKNLPPTVIISIHSPRMGRDRRPCQPQRFAPAFQSTLPAWGETRRPCQPQRFAPAFQSTLPAWGETELLPLLVTEGAISIHSPRMGRDLAVSGARWFAEDFNPLSPHGERHVALMRANPDYLFQSTLPAWGETGLTLEEVQGLWDFNPLSPHGERLDRVFEEGEDAEFQSTLPAWGETHGCSRSMRAISSFQSTLPAWGETTIIPSIIIIEFAISIHSPRMGRDIYELTLAPNGENFNPLSPHGERLFPPPF